MISDFNVLFFVASRLRVKPTPSDLVDGVPLGPTPALRHWKFDVEIVVND